MFEAFSTLGLEIDHIGHSILDLFHQNRPSRQKARHWAMWGRSSLIGVLKGSAADMNRTGRIEVGCLLDNRVCPRGDRHMTSCLVCLFVGFGFS